MATFRRLTAVASTLVASAALALGATPDGVAPARATTPGVRGPIVFSSNELGNWHLFGVRPNGTGLHQLTAGSGNELTPAYSPDGRHIAFAEAVSGTTLHQIYVMDADGTRQHRITHDVGDDWMPSWSPDARRIVFASFVDGAERIAVVGAQGTHQRFLTSGLANDGRPAWSPDGRRIAFATDRWTPGRAQLALMGTDGSHVVRLTDDATSDTAPVWSPNNTAIAYVASGGSAGSAAIDVVDASGLAPTPLTFPSAGVYDGDPTWSPDGRLVLFSRYQSGGVTLFTIDPYGGSPRQVPVGYAVQDNPSWGTVPIRCQGRWATISGTSDYDVLMGTPGSDVIAARGGADTVFGLGGDDVVCGGSGDDVLLGGAGGDVLVGGGGADRLSGGEGNDRLVARDGHRDPTINCGPGAREHATWDAGVDPHPRSC